MNSYELARALKAAPDLQRIPLIAVTAFAMVGDHEKAMAAGFDGYLTKPIDPTTFVAQLEAFLAPPLRGVSPAPAGETPDADSAPRPAGRRILVIGNDLNNLELASSVLGCAGYTVVTTADADAAFVMARQDPPALIISDVCMPAARSGFEWIRRVKLEANLKDVPFVFVTSTATDERSWQEGLALGAVQFLFRPLEAQVLLEVVDRCLRGNPSGSG